MRVRLLAIAAIAATGCGGLLAPETGAGDGGLTDSSTGSAGADGGTGLGERGPAPVPVCSGQPGVCVPTGPVTGTGAAVIVCNPVEYVGPWNLLLEREVGGQFQVVQTHSVLEPGFGWTFDDTTAPVAEEGNVVVYEVCATDPSGTRCGGPITAPGAPVCTCEADNCKLLQLCDTTMDDGCGRPLVCGACENGATCNHANHSCCPVGQQPDGTGGCECAPTRPCRGYWDPNLCECVGM